VSFFPSSVQYLDSNVNVDNWASWPCILFFFFPPFSPSLHVKMVAFSSFLIVRRQIGLAYPFGKVRCEFWVIISLVSINSFSLLFLSLFFDETRFIFLPPDPWKE